MADKVADVADFVSIGTNDLTQYTLAADRTLGSVANYQTAWHPAVLRAIKMICDAGNAKGMPVGVCGEAAADPDLAVVLAGLGVNSLSMTRWRWTMCAPPSPKSPSKRPRPRRLQPSMATSTSRPSDFSPFFLSLGYSGLCGCVIAAAGSATANVPMRAIRF